MDMSNACFEESFFSDKTNSLIRKLKSFSKAELSTKMKIRGKLLDSVFDIYDNFQNAPVKSAIESYTGFVFKELDLVGYTKEQRIFLENHFIILSALYGCVLPADKIRAYRLDMTVKVDTKVNLNTFWKAEINTCLKQIMLKNNEDTLINLASNEFSKLIDRKNFSPKIIDIEFKEEASGGFKIVSTYSKKARGMMSDYIIKNKISRVKDIKLFERQEYFFNKFLSTDNKYVFTR